MSVVLLDPRFPAMLPVEAVPLLGDDVCYTEEVPVRIRWVIADLGGHTVDDTEVIVTTDLANEAVMERLERGDTLVKAPSLLMEMAGDREIEAASDPALTATTGQQPAAVDYSGGGVVDGEIVGTDDHTAAVAGLRRTSRTEVPSSVMDEVEDAVALMTRAMRQGEWEQSQTHHSLLAYLREETEELAEVIDQVGPGEDESGIDQQELCTELSDILLQVLFHAEIANRRGAFDIGHVAGAFVAKMRSRAPYLFEEVERPVSRDEQDRLWAEGRVAEGKPAHKEEPTHREEPHATTFAAVKNPAGTPSAPSAPSALAAAEEVIILARRNGLADSEIPTDIRFPMIGLERDNVGDSDNRLITAVETFRRELEHRFGESADSWGK
ncbi:MazG nucleotide pyrophosphohydrolase domain-containing protein [Corynebacterium glyciniphilum]|uniref:MazG nucleotide pyrophosphohydrolase domain-containing protein n=1 Tax=Corynebacterium glyciniphilum TaxID=1404244 RepID=UPI0011AB85AC|nr:MazG nucleotide pyrophosphohydrolase domain-containing protein [Corynebacterium glyciniphilum]